MNKPAKIASLCVILFAALFLTACANKDNEEPVSDAKQSEKEYDLLIYNSNTKIDESFEAMCNEYSSRTGVIVKAVTTQEDENADEKLDSYMNSGEAPDIYTIKNMKELKKWQSSGNVLDFSNATQEDFKNVANGIPQCIRLSSNTVDSFGLPYTITGCGYVVDPKMLSALFGGDKYRSALEDLKECDYEEFEGFVNALKFYIEGNSIYEFQLNKNTYTFLDNKTKLSSNLNGVFAFSAGTPVYTGRHMLSPALAYKFNSAAEASIAANDTISSSSSIFYSFARGLDLLTSSVSGKTGKLSRGIELIDNVSNSSNQALKNFVNGQALFLLADNSIYDSMFVLDSDLANRVSFVPIKMPSVIGEKIASNINENVYKQSIVVSVPMYFAINAKSDENHQKLAQDFLVWLKTSELAQKYILQDFKFIPYDIKESSAIDNQLSKKMIEYVSSNHMLPSVADGLPESMSDDVAKNIINKYYTVPTWSFEEYDTIAQEIISIWKKLH